MKQCCDAEPVLIEAEDGSHLQDVFSDESDLDPPDPAPQPGKAKPAEDAWAVPRLAQHAVLLMANNEGNEDFSGIRCPVAASDKDAATTACCIQRDQYRNVTVLGHDSNLVLQVRRLTCTAHSREGRQAVSFTILDPAVRPQLDELNIRITPPIISLNRQTHVTIEAYTCDSSPACAEWW